MQMTAQIEDRFYFRRRVFSVVDSCGGTLFNPEDFGLYVASADDACRRGYVAEFAVDAEERLIIRNLYASPLDCKSELGRLAVERLRKKRELARLLADFDIIETVEGGGAAEGKETVQTNAARLRAEIAALEAEFPWFDNEDEFHRDLLARRADEAGLFDGAAPTTLSDDATAGCRFLYEECDLPLDFTGTILIGADCVAEPTGAASADESFSDRMNFGLEIKNVEMGDVAKLGFDASSSGKRKAPNVSACDEIVDPFDSTDGDSATYKTLLELDFENGVLQSATDCSAFGTARPDMTNEVERAVETANDELSVADWLERAFDDGFLSQWKRKEK